MRTTLTLDDDVAALLSKVRAARKAELKEIVNEALRHGLMQMTSQPRLRKPFQTHSVFLGRCLVGNVDNVAEIIEIAEDETL